MNVDDRNKLNKLRVERLLKFFISSLKHCVIQMDAENTLSVYCPHSGIVDELMTDLEDLRSHAWLILGARKIMLYCICEEYLLQTNTR
jgi:hypothetical protein